MLTSHIIALLAAGSTLTASAPIPKRLSTILRREVPQEHSHEKYLTSVRALLALDNPDNIGDPVFGLLGAAAAAEGAPNIDPDCIQQATADQAFTNAKAAGDVQGMTDALVFRALERNSLGIGKESPLCTAVTAVNPEIAAITQHQDPAGANAAETNTAITLELARQIASIGGDPLTALDAGTFAPGDPNDNTFAGNTCDDANDAEGCIFTQNLLVPDATEDEIQAAADGAADGAGGAGDAANGNTAAVTTSAAKQNAADATATATAVTAADTVTADAGGNDNSGGAAAGGSGGFATIEEAAQLSSDVDLGDCSHIAIGFAAGINNRKETAFTPADPDEFPQAEAQNINIVTNALCNGLVNNCGLKAGDEGVTVCEDAKAQIAQLGADERILGSAADQWNALFGITTNFASVDAIDNQGNVVSAGAGGGAANAGGNAANDNAVDNAAADSGSATGNGNVKNAATLTSSAAVSAQTSQAAENATADAGGASTGDAATDIAAAAQLTSDVDLGTCNNVALAFGENIEGRTETSFIPANLEQFNHGSAQNPNIITQFMCDQLVNACGLSADDEGAATCADAEAAVAALGAQERNSGATADLFNSFFGITTNFAASRVIDNQGNVVSEGAGAVGNGATAAGAGAVDSGKAGSISAGAGQGTAGQAGMQNAGAGKAKGAGKAQAAAQGAAANDASGSASKAGAGKADTGAAAGAADDKNDSVVGAADNAAVADNAANNAGAAAAGASGENLQQFTGALGDIAAPTVTAGGRGFVVEDNDDFVNLAAALGRSCDVQKNKCANASNGGQRDEFSVADCDAQGQECRAGI